MLKIGDEVFCCQQQFAIGVNEVTRVLERMGSHVETAMQKSGRASAQLQVS